MIFARWALPVNRQVIMYRATRLADDARPVADYTDGNLAGLRFVLILQAVPQLQYVIVNRAGCPSFNIPIEEGITIRNLKEIIAKTTGIDLNSFELNYKGHWLRDDTALVSDDFFGGRVIMRILQTEQNQPEEPVRSCTLQ